MTEKELEDYALETLKRKYVQRADQRQKDMGLSYTEAETTDLARTMARYAINVINMHDRELRARGER